MSKVETIRVEVSDEYGEHCFGDGIDVKEKVLRKPMGKVEVFEELDGERKKIYSSDNLVVYLGREYVAVRVFNVDNASIVPVKEDFIGWLGLGDGGVTPGDPLDPILPTNTDTDMASEVPISSVDTSYGDFRGGFYYKHPIDTVVYYEDDANDDQWLIAQVTTTIGSADANGELLSEAGLYVAPSKSGGESGPFSLFARVTFPTIVKDVTRQLVFVWYIYF